MNPTGDTSFSRRLLLITTIFGVFVLCDIALFGWLIFRSLSQREINQIILEARTEAEGLARQIAEEAADKDLYTAIALESETQTYIDSVLSQREIVETVEIRDKEGKLVFRSERTTTDNAADMPQLENAELPPQIETKRFERETPFEIVEVPVGDVGSFVIGISRPALERRLSVLRAELMHQTGLIAVLTLILLVSSYLLIWWLMRRGHKLEGKAKEAERMAYVGTLASGLAHEIRSPLNSLNLNMQMLEEEANDRGTLTSGRQLLAITRSEISRLERLVSDFLTYARPHPLELEEVPALELLTRTREVLAGQIQAHGARVRIEDRSDGARVRVDRSQMNQLLLNLAQNALAATTESGRSPDIRLLAERQGSRVVLEVRDNGVGIRPEERGRIFDLFYSTRKGGTGLGLAIVARIAQAHNGELEVDSKPGQGTAVRVFLPSSVGKERAQEGQAPRGQPLVSASKSSSVMN